MLWYQIRRHNSKSNRRTCVKHILRKRLTEIKPTKTPNEWIVEKISLPQKQKNHKSRLSAHSEILLSHLLLCCTTQFGTIEARTTAVPVLSEFYAKVEGNQAKKYLEWLRSRGDMTATKSTTPAKKSKKLIFSQKIS